MNKNRLQLAVGDRFLIYFSGETSNIRTEVLGYSSENFIIISAPLIPGIRQKALDKRSVIVRYFSDGIVYGFESSLINYLNKPEPLLFITYPDNIEVMELRKNKRVNCNMPAKVYLQDDPYQGLIVDISLEGCRIFIDELKNSEISKIEKEESIYLDLFPLTGEENIQAKGIIKNINAQKSSLFLGIQFDSQTESLKPISDYLAYVENLLNIAR
ncbi:MAG: flagellar brake protein [Desulfohalobiaceae bacterium]